MEAEIEELVKSLFITIKKVLDHGHGVLCQKQKCKTCKCDCGYEDLKKIYERMKNGRRN